jgi:chromosome segregation ATPase
MPEWTVAIVIAVIGAISGAIPGFAALHKARLEHEATIRDSELAARQVTTKEWESLTQSQRATLEEYRTRLQTVTERMNDLECQLIAARGTIQTLEDRAQEQAAMMQEQAQKILRLEQERAQWGRERTALQARITELEACR